MTAPPPKPWERNRPAGSTALTSAKPWEQPGQQSTSPVPAADTATPGITPARPWERSGLTSTAPASTSYLNSSQYGGGYNPSTYGGMYNRGPYGNSMYGSSGMYGNSMYGGSPYGSGGLYGSSMYGRGTYGSGMYGSGMYGSSMYGSGMYGGGYGGGPYAGSYGFNRFGSPYGGLPQNGPPFDPNHPPAGPPSAWQHMLAAINGVMQFFGRLSFLVDENAHAVHFFISALLQLLDRAGSLYGEIARFILRLIFRRQPKAMPASVGGAKQLLPPAQGAFPEVWNNGPSPGLLTGPAGTTSVPSMSAVQWDNLWGDN